MLDLSSHLPELAVETGDAIVREGGAAGGIWVLVSGSLVVRKGDVVVGTIDHPGSTIGEMSVLLDAVHSATVEAAEPSRLRFAEDGKALLASDPHIATLIATGLAERLKYVTSYLADLKHQYGDAPGLTIVANVLNRLGHHSGPPVISGSAREPNPEY